MTKKLTHLDDQGRLRMVDVGEKPPMKRRAVAEGFFCASSETITRVMQGDLPKGEALAAARIAGIQAAKQCAALIPLCHTLPLDHVEVGFERSGAGDSDAIIITASASLTAKTGVEMEALTAVAVAALTLWDMTKAIDKELRIEGIRLVEKSKEPLAE